MQTYRKLKELGGNRLLISTNLNEAWMELTGKSDSNKERRRLSGTAGRTSSKKGFEGKGSAGNRGFKK